MLFLFYLTTSLLFAVMPLDPASPTAIFSSSLSAWASSTDAWFTSSPHTWMASTSGSVHSTSGHISLAQTVSGLGYQRSSPWGVGRRFVQQFEQKRWRLSNAALATVWLELKRTVMWPNNLLPVPGLLCSCLKSPCKPHLSWQPLWSFFSVQEPISFRK